MGLEIHTPKTTPNVGKYAMHGVFGIDRFFESFQSIKNHPKGFDLDVHFCRGPSSPFLTGVTGVTRHMRSQKGPLKKGVTPGDPIKTVVFGLDLRPGTGRLSRRWRLWSASCRSLDLLQHRSLHLQLSNLFLSKCFFQTVQRMAKGHKNSADSALPPSPRPTSQDP